MATIDEKVDFLWKKIFFGVSKTDIDTVKFGSNETIPSKVNVLGQDIWAQATTADIPVNPPASNTGIVQVRKGANRIQATMDTTATANRSWLTSLIDWIQPTFGSNYAVAVYIGDPNVGPAARIFPDTTGEGWVFDYSNGVLHFPTAVPGAKTATIGSGTVNIAGHGIYIEGYRYTGTKGLGGAGANIRVSEVTHSGADVLAGDHTLVDFFANVPQPGTIDVMFNGVRLDFDAWTASGTDLILHLDQLPYWLEAGDTVSAQYGYAG